nr:MAG: virion protein [Equine parapoxvirus]
MGSIYLPEGGGLRVAAGEFVVVFGAGALRVRAPRAAFAAEYALAAPAGAPLTATLRRSGFRCAGGGWAAAADFAAAGAPAAWAGDAAEVPADGLTVLAWTEGGAAAAAVVARARDAESRVGDALRSAAFDARAPAARMAAAAAAPAPVAARARVRLLPGADPRARLCANRDRLRAFAVGWFGAQLSGDGAENEKIFAAFDRLRAELDDA